MYLYISPKIHWEILCSFSSSGKLLFIPWVDSIIHEINHNPWWYFILKPVFWSSRCVILNRRLEILKLLEGLTLDATSFWNNWHLFIFSLFRNFLYKAIFGEFIWDRIFGTVSFEIFIQILSPLLCYYQTLTIINI